MGKKPDLAISIVFPDKVDCPTAPADAGHRRGHAGPGAGDGVRACPGGVGTNTGSTQTTITAEEALPRRRARAAQARMVSPWNDPQYFYGRPATKGTQVSIGANIGVAASKWQLLADPQHQIDQSNAVATSIAAQTSTGNAEKTIGILGAEVYDPARAMMHALAFRAFKQLHSYWPDSSPTTFDKKNVRDGHYPFWSYVQYLAPQAARWRRAQRRARRRIIDLLAGNAVTTSPAFEPLDTVIADGLVPACAMKVSRTVEGGDLSPYSVARAVRLLLRARCRTARRRAPCVPTTRTCGGGKCRHGYCEAK